VFFVINDFSWFCQQGLSEIPAFLSYYNNIKSGKIYGFFRDFHKNVPTGSRAIKR